MTRREQRSKVTSCPFVSELSVLLNPSCALCKNCKCMKWDLCARCTRNIKWSKVWKVRQSKRGTLTRCGWGETKCDGGTRQSASAPLTAVSASPLWLTAGGAGTEAELIEAVIFNFIYFFIHPGSSMVGTMLCSFLSAVTLNSQLEAVL